MAVEKDKLHFRNVNIEIGMKGIVYLFQLISLGVLIRKVLMNRPQSRQDCTWNLCKSPLYITTHHM